MKILIGRWARRAEWRRLRRDNLVMLPVMVAGLVAGCAAERTQRDAEAAQKQAYQTTKTLYELWVAGGRRSRAEYRLVVEAQARAGGYRSQIHLSSLLGYDRKLWAMWQRRAARQGSYLGQYLTGFNYFDGHGVRKDHRLAFYWMRRAAHQGYPSAQVVLSLYYRHGIGTARDAGYADRWLQAARHSMPRLYRDRPGAAAYRIATTHLCGYGAPASPAVGRRFLAEAARAGHPRARLALSLRFDDPARRKRNCDRLAAAGRKMKRNK